jgi:hypothetical protein
MPGCCILCAPVTDSCDVVKFGWRASATAMRMMTRAAPIAAIRRDTGSVEPDKDQHCHTDAIDPTM